MKHRNPAPGGLSLKNSGSRSRGVSGDVVERFYAIGFSLEQMRQNLRDLERCVSDWSEATGTIAGKPADEIL